MKLARFRDDALCLAAAFLPVLGDAVWKAFVQPRPFWAFFYDPETFYFHDGLRLLHGRAPLDVTHPGTPVQALSGLVAAVTGATSATPQQFDRFRTVAYSVAWGLQLLGAIVLLRTVLARLPTALRITVLVTYFLAAKSLEYETVWSPELFYFVVGTLALSAVWWALGRNLDGRSAFVTGASVGLACAVKFLFLPWLVAACFTAAVMGGSGSRRLRALVGVVAGALLAFLVATLPAASRWPDMMAWVTRIASRSGQYGESPQVMPDLGTLVFNLASLLAGAKGWYLWLLLAGSGAWFAVRQARTRKDSSPIAGMALFSLTAMAIGHALVLRSPDAHYLLPSAVAAVGLVAVAAYARQLRDHTAASATALVLAAMLLGKHLVSDGRTHVARNKMATNGRATLAAAVLRAAGNQHRPVVVYGYGVPIPSLALRYFATDPQLLSHVEAIYPAEGHLGPGDRLMLPAGASTWDVLVLQRRDDRRVAPSLRAVVVEQVGTWEVLVPGGDLGPAEVAP